MILSSTLEDKILGLLNFMDEEFIDLKFAIESNNKGEPYNLKHIKDYLDIWYGDLTYINIEGIRYYPNTAQFVHALLDAIFFTETEGAV